MASYVLPTFRIKNFFIYKSLAKYSGMNLFLFIY